ncbi:hypothetical protein Dxin01_02097 [Deinococcus xinjiangensis]|uniref:Uncharacterized protein n=1 Tax=Deinococcus xinjiangensis TaxID=457454 RepID=A0ABP9VE43_9DEIO
MLDNLLSTVKRGAERVQRKGEEVAQVARLKMEVFQLNRELDGHYARLGRSYHAGAELDLLQGVREDIRRVEEEIQARERLIEELGGTPDEPAAAEKGGEIVPVKAAAVQAAEASAPAEPSQSTGHNAPNFVAGDGAADKPATHKPE